MIKILLEEIEWQAPTKIFGAFKGMPWAHCFNSGNLHENARWSTIVAFPSTRVIHRGGQVYVNDKPTDDDLIHVLRSLMAPSPHEEGISPSSGADLSSIPFVSGLAGYIGYEIGGVFEPVLSMPASPYEKLPDLALARYEAAIIFDRQNTKTFIAHTNEIKSRDAATQLRGFIEQSEKTRTQKNCYAESPRDENNNREGQVSLKVRSVQTLTDKKEYCEQVAQIIEAILEGDFFQANLSRRIKAEFNVKPDMVALYTDIIEKSDAAYAALLQFEEGSLLSNSPERFFSVENISHEDISPVRTMAVNSMAENSMAEISMVGAGGRKIIAEPIKGTIQRGNTKQQDKDLARKLMSNEKDRAENIMIADLLRNDLSRVCHPASIREEEICSLMSLNYVHHLMSRISGILRSEYDSFDALRALFPCGSITGAPKIEAMNAISHHEKVGRGPYCGTIGYFDDRGGADLSVAIRTLVHDEGEETVVSIPVGGGVTLRSDPQSEYEETQVKALGFTNLLDVSSLKNTSHHQ